mgnify:CR=1 FL=1
MPASFTADLDRIPREHPRLLGPRSRLQQLAQERPDAYRRMSVIARERPLLDPTPETKDFGAQVSLHSKVISQALVAAVEDDRELGRATVELVWDRLIAQPIPYGHVPFGSDVALCALAYDLCCESWTDAERERCRLYCGEIHDANRWEEPSVFHNGWYGYKNWGFGLAWMAFAHEWPRAGELWHALDREYRERAAPALELAGDGGGFAEGFYINYWLYSWLFFCESARLCAGIDYYALAPRFYRQRALASAFETFPGRRERNSRRSLCIGDGRGRFFRNERDHELAARRILASHYGDDPIHRSVQQFNRTTPQASADEYAYRDFLWNDPAAPTAAVEDLPLSHCSRGPGFVYARSSWQDDATHFFVKCGRRFTAHQHCDVGHFGIYKHEELLGEAGHYDTFGGPHDSNFYARSIAHNTLLVRDPAERVPPGFRAFVETVPDGGQHHDWVGQVHHNGGASDAAEWYRNRELFDVGELLAYREAGAWMYVAGDASRAYAAGKLRLFTRQILFVRPDTFLVFDRVESTRPEFRKTVLLQAMKKPERQGEHWVIANGRGRLFVQTLLPANADVELREGEAMYEVAGKRWPPKQKTGPEVECRMEISPRVPACRDCFLTVLTAADSSVQRVPL